MTTAADNYQMGDLHFLEAFYTDLKRLRDSGRRLLKPGSTVTHTEMQALEDLRESLVRRRRRATNIIDKGLTFEVSGRTRNAWWVAFDFSDQYWDSALQGVIDQTNEAIGELEGAGESIPEFPIGRIRKSRVASEATYSSGNTFDAYLHIKEIVHLATSTLYIVDPYTDGALFELLLNVQSGTTIRILTRNMRGDFRAAYNTFQTQWKNVHKGKIEIKTDNKEIHDRYIVIDNVRIFALGASIKDAGTKVTNILEIEQPEVKTSVLNVIEESWNNGLVI